MAVQESESEQGVEYVHIVRKWNVSYTRVSSIVDLISTKINGSNLKVNKV